MKPIGLAIWGLHHQHPRWYWPLLENLPAFKPLCIVEEDREFLAREAEFFKVAAHADADEMLAREDVEAVLIFVPHSRMPEAVERAVAAGKHVLVEKPMAADADGARRVVRAAQATKLKVATGYYWRFDPMAARLRELIAAGALGRILHLQGRMNAQGPWRYVRDNALWMLQAAEGGGPMFNLGVHWIDLFHWLTGLEVRAVSGAVNSSGGEPQRTIEDSASAILEYDGGAIGLLDISYALPRRHPQGRDLWVSVRGSEGCAVWLPSLGHEDYRLTVVSEHPALGGRMPLQIREAKPQVRGYCGQMGLDALNDWARAIREDRPVGVPVADGLRAAIVAEAVLTSAAEKRRVEL